MGYNRDNYRRIRREYDGKNLRAKEEAESRAAALREKIPALAEIDRALSGTGMKILAAAQAFRGEDLEREIARLREENRVLQAERAAILTANGYPADYTAPRYECELCEDLGTYRMKICRCMRKKLILAGYETSGIGSLIRTQSFETFRPEVQGEHVEHYRSLLEKCRRYAAEFDGKQARNLLFMGGTGLGKTHLSTAIAKAVIEGGCDVAYVTAVDLFGDYETERFGTRIPRAEDEPPPTNRYIECDLLIIDDLGTELTNQFTQSVLYNLLDSRLNRGRSTLISTNLTGEELRRRYTDRIASRLFGNYLAFVFRGEDVRMKKIMK